jgi:hypothetical protein
LLKDAVAKFAAGGNRIILHDHFTLWKKALARGGVRGERGRKLNGTFAIVCRAKLPVGSQPDIGTCVSLSNGQKASRERGQQSKTRSKLGRNRRFRIPRRANANPLAATFPALHSARERRHGKVARQMVNVHVRAMIAVEAVHRD